VNFPVCVCC